jgi:hypothetical protein
LNEALAGKNLRYNIVSEKSIVIYDEKRGSETNQKQPRKVTGIVKDSHGESIIGASVSIPGTTIGGITDLDGKYSITVPDKEAVLNFSYIGYTAVEEKIENRSVIDVVLRDDTKQIDEVVVIGYGSRVKKDITTAISNISSETLTSPLFRANPITN